MEHTTRASVGPKKLEEGLGAPFYYKSGVIL